MAKIDKVKIARLIRQEFPNASLISTYNLATRIMGEIEGHDEAHIRKLEDAFEADMQARYERTTEVNN